MGVRDVMTLSLGEWVMIARAWNKAHGGKSDVAPPSEAQFEAAIYGTVH